MTLVKLLFPSLVILSLTACSSNPPNINSSEGVKTAPTANNLQTVQQGTIVSLSQVSANRNTSFSDMANIGISVGSGGHRGIFGAFNAGKVIEAITQPTLTEMMIKKTNGEHVVVTQPTGNFKVGDRVKILIRNGQAIVQH